ncbi:MAG: lysophospholipid acyltransferase family protein [Bacteroidales bacterium]|nr:lysophospholipid acyltransferase family protein [Bacteroidales bacterium]
MKFLGYILTYSLVWMLHLLPERILYLISDLLYLLAYYVVGYRKKVVYNNLEKAFPDYNQPEIRRTAKRFYHHLCDIMLESAVFHFYSEKKALKKITYKNPELLNEIHRSGKHVMAVVGHYGNWEYLSTLCLVTDHPFIGIYKPLKNKYFDQMVVRNRTRFGANVTPMEKIARLLIDYNNRKEPVLTVFLGDQRPMFHQIQYWTKFMGRDTPMYLGTEKLARKLDAAVVFLKFRKPKRGRYEVEAELICDEPGRLKPYEITERHVCILEEMIREEPAYWLWSHRRWKHSYEKFQELKASHSG